MNRKLAQDLKAAGFPIRAYQIGHRFYPHENSLGWPEATRKSGITISPYELQHHLQDIEDGYYCPSLADLIEACGENFARLYLEKTIWTAKSKDPDHYAMADSPEGAVARLWFVLHKKNPCAVPSGNGARQRGKAAIENSFACAPQRIPPKVE